MTKKEYKKHEWQPNEKVWTILYTFFEIKDEMGKWVRIEYPKQIARATVWSVRYTGSGDTYIDYVEKVDLNGCQYLSDRNEDIFFSEEKAKEYFQKIKESRKIINLYMNSVETANKLLNMYIHQKIKAEKSIEIWKEERKYLIHNLLNMNWLDK